MHIPFLDQLYTGFLYMNPSDPDLFRAPRDEPAFVDPDSVSWQIFKSPIALYIGGMAAVMMELAEPRVAAGVWDHSDFQHNPKQRLQRTGLSAQVTVFAAKSVAADMIGHIRQRHETVRGTTPDGTPYEANDPALLSLVQTSASFGFCEAYHHFVSPLSELEKNAFFAEAEPIARAFGVTAPATSFQEARHMLRAWRPLVDATPPLRSFLHLMRTSPVLPVGAHRFQGLFVEAARSILPKWMDDVLPPAQLNGPARWMLRRSARFADQMRPPESPAVLSCERLGVHPEAVFS